MTMNLHLIAVELDHQIDLAGCPSTQIALWIERFLQVLVEKNKI